MPRVNRDGRVVPVHRLRANETVWTPPSVVFLDSESRWIRTEHAELHTLRLWAACHVDRRKVRRREGPVTWGFGETPADLAAWLTRRSSGRECLWLYAHNLDFDLVVCRLPEAMCGAGWSIKEFSFSGGSPFIRFGLGKKTLTVCDSWSWLPESLESIAARIGADKRPLPANDDGSELWQARCGRDVELLARAVLGLMAWWDAEHLGRWSISGASCGYNAMRHIGSTVRHVIDPEPELVGADRLAVRGGRKDSAVVRSETGGPWVELDLEAAYPTVARELPLPTKRAWSFDSLPLDSRYLRSRFYGPIAECTVTTEVPRYPVRHRGVTWYPVGTFRTHLAGPELAWAAEAGHLVSIGGGQMHRLGFALRPWATWVLDPSRGGTVEVPPVGLVACRHWGRAVIGKFAGRASTTVALEGEAPPGWRNRELVDRPTGHKGAEVAMGGRAWLVTAEADTENAYPAVLAWVESEVRVRLGRVLEATEGNWWTADTDGLILDLEHAPRWSRTGTVRLAGHARSPEGAGQALCDALAPLVAPLRLRPKRSFTSLRVLGPQHLLAGGTRRMSGVSKDATEVEPDAFVGLDWPRLRWQLGHSSPGTYTRPERRSTFRRPTVHRWVLADGTTRPVEMTWSPERGNEILAWECSRWAAEGLPLAELQYGRLARVG